MRHAVLFPLATVVLLGAMLAGMYSTALRETPAADELAHLPFGYTYLKTGNFWFDQVHPALSRLLMALPLLAVNPRVPTEHESWRTYDFFQYRLIFFYHNRVRPEVMLMLGRGVTMLVTLGFGLLLVLWTRRQFGAAAGLLALAFFALDPNFLAFGKYTTTDMYTVVVFFCTLAAWTGYLKQRQFRFLALTGIALGAALATKHSMVVLFGLLPILYAVRWWQQPRRFSLIRLLVSMTFLFVVGFGIVGLVYWPATRWVLLQGGYSPLADKLDPSTPAGAAMIGLARLLHLPYHPYLMGFYYIGNVGLGGTPSYILGKVIQTGRWYFFPVAFAVKNTTAFLAALSISIGAVLGVVARRDPEFRFRQLPIAWFTVTLAPAIYFLLCLPTQANEGYRHLMPIVPLLFAFTGAVLGSAIEDGRLRKARTWLVTLLLALLVTESALAWPHYLAFFNLPSGGAANGHRYLVNSNLDWGQDLGELRDWLKARGNPDVCLAYIVPTDPAYYGIKAHYLPTTREAGLRENLDCYAAISLTTLVGVYSGPDSYSWLRKLEPVAKISQTIYIYDLRKPARGK